MHTVRLLRCRESATVCSQPRALLAGIVVAACCWGNFAVAREAERATIQEACLRPGGESMVRATVDRLIGEAARAKANGQSAVAYSLLHRVVRDQPENSLARWQLGQVKVGGEWLSVEEAQRRAEADPRLVQYQLRRELAGDSPQGQLALAKWCRGNKLEDEAKVHWANVLAIDPKNREALRSMSARWQDGELKSFAQIREDRQESSEAKQAKQRWAVRVASWMRKLADKNDKPLAAVLEEIRSVDDPAAIPAVEEVTLTGRLAANEKNVAVRRLGLAFVSALDKMKGEASTNSLLRHAVMSSSVDVRVQAIGELRYRPLEDFVPTLIDNLVAPMQSDSKVVNDPDGSVHYLHSIYREGPFKDWAYESERSIYQPGSQTGFAAGILANPTPVTSSLPGMDVSRKTPARAVSRAGAGRSARDYEQEIVKREREVAEANEKSEALNERIISVLEGTTEQSLGRAPRRWWDWWSDYTDYYRGGSRPVSRIVDRTDDYIIPPVEMSSACECFVRGTLVWTKTGQRPIERISPGDFVLSQDVNSGEIRYKPVLARTLRPAGPIVELATGDEKFLATRGHPLWVAGVGWRMTKELRDGAILESLTGTSRVKSVQSAADAETYNLVVADFNTYFIGSSGILAHDNTPRRPTQALLPGILEK